MTRHKANASAVANARGSAAMGVVDEVEVAFSPRSRLATQLGFVLGGVIPIATYLEAHCELDVSQPLYTQPAAFLVAGGLLFSAKTVFAWGQRAFRDAWKAAGFVVLLEGVMITSHVPVLPLVLLAILVAINGIATGCTLSLERRVSRAERSFSPGFVVPAPTARREPSVSASADVEVVTGIVQIAGARRRSRAVTAAAQEQFAFDSEA